MAVTLFLICLISSSAWALSGPPSQPKKQTPSLRPSAIYADSAKKNFVSLASVFDSRPLLISGPFGEFTGTDPTINWRPGKLKRYSAPKGEERQIRRGYSEESSDSSEGVYYAPPYQPPQEEKPQIIELAQPIARQVLRVVEPIYRVVRDASLWRVAGPDWKSFRIIDPKKTEVSLVWLSSKGRGHAPYWKDRPINANNAYLSRAGRPELIELIETIAEDVFDETGQPLLVSDLNGRGHKGHKRGIEADILIRLKDDVSFKGGSISKIRGLNRGSGPSFKPGSAYDREETIKVIKKFLDYSEDVWLKEGQTLEKCAYEEDSRCNQGSRPRLIPCKQGEPGCRNYDIEVTKVLISDHEIGKRFSKDKHYRGLVMLWPNHANHFHIKIDFLDAQKVEPHPALLERSRNKLVMRVILKQ